MAGDKKRRGRAYLNDFERDLTGSYHYRGAHYRYTGSLPRGRALARLWGLSLFTLAALLGAGLLDGPGLGRCFYVLIPYAAACVGAVSVVYTVGRLTANGDPLREYVLEQTVRKLPVRGGLTRLLAALSAVGGVIFILSSGPNWERVVFVLLCAAAFAAQLALGRQMKDMDWQKMDSAPGPSGENSID